jgi:outer membrane protein assembly factor BamB
MYREGPEFLQVADVNGDGREEILYGAGNTLFVLDPDGKLLWRFATKDRVRSCAVGDLNGDGAPEVALGGNDELVHLLDAPGAEIRSWHCDVQLISGQGHGRNPEVTALALADLNGDGKVEVLAGTRNCWLLAYTIDGKELWKDSAQYHGVRRILVADLDADGKSEVLSANRYGGIRIYSGDGKQKPGTASELGDVSMALGRAVPGDYPLIVNGSSTGVLTARTFATPPVQFGFNNQGFGVNEVACADVNGDGLDEILIASETGYLYCLDGQGKEVWRTLVGAVVRDVAVGDLNGDGKLEVLCGAEDGTARVLSGAGQVLGASAAEGSVAFTAICRTGKRGLGVAASRSGQLRAMELE